MSWQQVRSHIPSFILSLLIATFGRWAMASEGWVTPGTWQYFVTWQAIFTVNFGIHLLLRRWLVRRYRRRQQCRQSTVHVTITFTDNSTKE